MLQVDSTKSSHRRDFSFKMAKPSSRSIVLVLILNAALGWGDLKAQNTESPGSPSASDYRESGNVKYDKGDFDGAIADFTQAIKIEPKFAKAFQDRAKANEAKGNLVGAIADYTKEIELTPLNTRAYIDRGIVRQKSGDLDGALTDYSKVTELDPDNPVAYNNIAWVLATSSDASVRNGPKSLDNATKACELTGWSIPTVYGTLAASYAENGNFSEAVKWQSFYVKAFPGTSDALQRLELYKNRQPYREIK